VRDNTTQLLVQDIEQLREMLGIGQWLVFGGSWGSTLALAYGETHPERCTGFVLRGIFLCTQPEVDWFLYGIRHFFPQEHAAFAGHIPEAERGDLLTAYMQRLFSDDPAQNLAAARSWSRYEGQCVHLLPRPAGADDDSSARAALSMARLEAHYMRHGAFMEENQLLRNVGRIRHLPAAIIQGRYDVVCPPTSAWALHQAWPEARLQMVDDAGHAAFEPGIASALVAATDQFKLNGTL
jgi:proline iminopeptidase